MVTKKFPKVLPSLWGHTPNHTHYIYLIKKIMFKKKRRKGKKERLIKNSLFYIANIEDT